MDQHIRIGDVAPRVQYQADGVQTAFTYPFPIFERGDLAVWIDGVRQSSGFTVGGAGASEGGVVAFAAPPPAGARVTLRRTLPVVRISDFQENGVLRSRTLNDELDYQVAALQEVKEDLGLSLRLDPSDGGSLSTLPLREGRANRILGFDSLGDVAVFNREEGTLTVRFPGAVPRTVEDKLAERLSARDFGAAGDGVTDDGPALQAAMNAAAATGKTLEIGEGSFRTTMPLRLPGAAAGLTMRGAILYAGPDGRTALTIGDATARAQARRYAGLRVVRAAQSDWSNEADIGIRLLNLDACVAEVLAAEGFTIGLRTEGSGVGGAAAGFEDSTIVLGRLINNRIGLDVHCSQPGPNAWNNSVRYIGGHFANGSTVNPTQARFGVRFSATPGGYQLHNAHVFMGPAFELQRQGTPGAVDAIPFLLEVNGRGLVARGVRMEACSPFVARHVTDFNDAIYEVAYVGTYAFAGNAVDYPATATRAGGTVFPLHQAAAAVGTPRLVASAENVRLRAFRQTLQSSAGIGFDQMAVLSSNPSGPPTTLNGFCFAGLGGIGVNADTVQLPTSRALGFVVDCARCKEFFLAVEGDNMRPVFLQFDAAENLLGGDTPLLLSNANVNWNPGEGGAGTGNAFWWEMNSNLDSLTAGIPLNRLQRVTFHPSARYGVIGVRGGDSVAPQNNLLRSFRLFCAATEAPALLFGGSRAWGAREQGASVAWTVPTLVAGATASVDIAVAGVRQGDFVQAGFARSSGFWNGGLIFHAAVGGTAGTDQVRVTVQNITGGNIAGADGTLFVRAVKPKL